MMETNRQETLKQAQMADMEDYKRSPYYQSIDIGGLEEQLKGYQTSGEALRAQAEAEYLPAYQTELEALRQELAGEVQGLQGQSAALGAAYDRQRRQVNEAYDESAADLDNRLNKRGMGRSSLVSTQGAYLENRRNQELAGIGRDEAEAVSAINEKIALLTGQAAQSERTMAQNYARQLEQRISKLREQNRSAAVSLQLQISALQQQGYEAYQNWLLENRERELAERKYADEQALLQAEAEAAAKKSGGSSSKKTAVQTAKKNGNQAAGSLNSVLSSLKEKLMKAAASAKKPAASSGGTSAMTGAKKTPGKFSAASR